ncbi:MAG: WHG domain-containing protein [Chloroflexota bacterium]
MPRAGLSRAVVIEEAADLADETGLDRLTLAALAARFGVAVPSLYKHVDGLEGVRRGITVLALRELTEAMAAVPDLRGRCLAYRAYAKAHPGRYAATIRAVPPDDADAVAAATALLALVNASLATVGLAGDAAIDGARWLRATLHGFMTLEAAGGFGMPREVERSFARAVEGLEAGLAALAADA